MGPYRILLADDHALFREGLKEILTRKADLEVVGEAGDGLELLKLMNSLNPHMVIVDISMPRLRGIEAIHEIKATHPEVKVLVLTMHKNTEYLHKALVAGAEGYLLKEDANPDLFSAIEKLRQGGTYVSPRLSEGLMRDWAKAGLDEGKTVFESEPLTMREREVLKLLAEGKSNRDIADLLFISVRTVEGHRASITKKLGLKKTADLVKYAIERGYV